MLERLEHVIGPDGEGRVPAAARNVAERVGEKRFADTDWADDGHVRVRLEERHWAGRRSPIQ